MAQCACTAPIDTHKHTCTGSVYSLYSLSDFSAPAEAAQQRLQWQYRGVYQSTRCAAALLQPLNANDNILSNVVAFQPHTWQGYARCR
eukprot:1148073-Pelagomonas_calceolata.AAC.3